MKGIIMSVGEIANTVARTTSRISKKSITRKTPCAVLEQYKAQVQLDNLKIQLETLEREESLIVRPNDRALKAIGERITECLKKISAMTDYIKSIPELYK